MREKNSLFKKYFSIYAVTLLICTFMLGVALLYFASQYFRDDNKTTLSAACSKAVETIELNYEKNGGKSLTRSEIEEDFSFIHRTTGSLVFYCDNEGRVEICSEGDSCTHVSTTVAANVRQTLLTKGEYFDAGYFGGFFQEGRYTYGEIVLIDDTIYGYVFVSTSLSELFTFLYQVTLMFLFSSLVTLAVSFVIIYYATRILTRPLREISSAAERFGEGDYTVRVNVTGNDEIGTLAEVFNTMADSVSELEMTRRSFVANVSHELRTPMTTIAGYIDGMLDGTIPRDQQSHYLQIVTDEVKRLSRLTSSLLDIARMEAGEQDANIVSHNAWDIVLNVMWNMEQRINDKGIEIKELDVVPRFVYCDADMLHQVVYNLLDNAIKFTPAGGYIAVEVNDHGAFTDIIIRNSGSGISSEDLSHVFERFYKSDKSRGLDKTGTGLGLYIVKTLVSRMNGLITADSRAGEYAEFMIKLHTGPETDMHPELKKEEKQSEREKKSFIDKLTKGWRKDDKR